MLLTDWETGGMSKKASSRGNFDSNWKHCRLVTILFTHNSSALVKYQRAQYPYHWGLGPATILLDYLVYFSTAHILGHHQFCTDQAQKQRNTSENITQNPPGGVEVLYSFNSCGLKISTLTPAALEPE